MESVIQYKMHIKVFINLQQSGGVWILWLSSETIEICTAVLRSLPHYANCVQSRRCVV